MNNTTNQNLQSALAHAAAGKPVFPCDKNKKPLTPHGFKDATTDPEIIRQWWKKSPDALIGIPAGASTGIIVLDIDLPDGPATLADLETENGLLPATLGQQTGSGGRHFLFQHPGFPVKNSAGKIGKGLDIRGDGGYIIVAPSPGYIWLNSNPIASAPLWLLTLIAGQKTVTAQGSPYGQAALSAELAELKTAPEGGRNTRLNVAAFSLAQLVAGGELDREQTYSALLALALEIGLTESEATATIRSGMEAGGREPRQGKATPAPSQESPLQGKFRSEDPFDLSRLTLGETIIKGDYRIAFVIDKLIPEGSITLFYGKGGCGKSTIATQIAASISTGSFFMGLKGVKRPAVFVDYENPMPVLKKRINLIEGAENIYFWTSNNNPPQLNKVEFAELLSLIKTLVNPVVIFDTLSSSCCELDILSNGDFSPVMQRIKELRNVGATVIFLHHTPKSDETKYIGASCIYNQVDHVIAMYPVKNADNEKEISDEDETKVYRIGTKDKTRYEHFSTYVVFDEDKSVFVPAENPDKVILNRIQQIIKEHSPINQSEIINRVGAAIPKQKLARLLKNNEGRLWMIERGEKNAKIFHPMPVIQFPGPIVARTEKQQGLL